ncbi:hypothetical protein KC221_27400, partial [Mycobacterium tuberculosis]|nr:hypothetical protein [Mycobacterium tuberculosis]
LSVEGLTLTALDAGDTSAKVDLAIGVDVSGDDWLGSVIYATDLYDEQSVATLMERCIRFLDAVTRSSSTPLGDVELLDPSERD